MKKTSLSIALFICVLLQINASSITIKDSKVMDVTVYRNYAKETRVGTSKIPAGNSEIIFSNITYSIDENSIQVGSKGGNIKILSVSTRINYLTEPNKDANPTKVKIWEDSIKLLQNKMGFLLKKIEVYESGLAILNNNNKLGNEHESLVPEMLKQLVELNLSKQLELKKLIFENYLEYSEINQEISVLQTQIYQGSSVGTSKAIREVVLKINAKEAETAQFKVSYITTAAYWVPTYEIRCENTTKPLLLSCRAKIVQTTGADWKDIKLKLSTANPNKNHNRPILYPIFVDFMQPDYYKEKMENGKDYNLGYLDAEKPMMKRVDVLQNMAYTSSGESSYIPSEDFKNGIQVDDNNVKISEGDMMVEYDIETLQDIESDGKEHIIGVQEITLPAIYNYHTVPKLDCGVFLLARITDWGKYNLLAGEATIFFDDMYIGKSYLNPNVSADTLLISLGIDDKIAVKRIKLSEFCSTKILGSKKKETKAFETVVKNNKNYAIEIEILDQYPISKNSEIEVTLDEAKEAQIIKEYGKVLWKIKLQPGESKKLRLIYTIKYPEEKLIQERN